ncbi:MAG: hypothetical protein KC593_14550 [Myxococcales bacterium]|nr:hypothetical protein [Myxococcales bacterium]MCB9628032.1 hypothetical protein [Sandaracinaceae bacterium]
MARILGLEIDGDVVRGALINVALRSTVLERYVEARVLPPVDVSLGNAEGPHGGPPAALHPNLFPMIDGEDEEAEDPSVSGADDTETAAEAPQTPLALAVRELLRQCGRVPDGIHVHLDGKQVSLRPMTLPAGAAKRLKEVLPGELEGVLPFDVADAVIHHQPISSEELTIRVLTAAVRREHVAASIAYFESAGIEPRQLAAGAATLDGLVPLLTALQTDAPVLVIDMGRESTDVCVLEGGRTVHARSISIGMDAVRAGEAGAVDELAGSLRRTVASHRMKGGEPLERVIVGGHGASEPAVRDWLSGVLDVSAETVALPAGDGLIPEQDLPRFMRVAALAGRSAVKGQRINLRQGEFASRHAAGEIRRYARLLAFSAAAILGSFAISLYTRYTVLDTERAELRAELGALTHAMFRQRTESPSQARTLVQGGASERDPMPRMGAYQVMGAIAELIPEDAQHTTRRLTISFDDEARDGELEIQGTVASVTQRDAIAAALEAHDCFSDVQPGATSSRNDILSYRIEAEIRCPGDQPEPEAANAAGRRDRGN